MGYIGKHSPVYTANADKLDGKDSTDFVLKEEALDESFTVALSGPALVYPDSTNTYTITDYDSFESYTVSSDVGSATVDGDTITLTIPAGTAAGPLVLTVSRGDGSKNYGIAVSAPIVAQPSMFYPSDGAADVDGTPALTSSEFGTIPSGKDDHASTDWQVATDAAFDNIAWESLGDTENLETVQMPAGALSESTSYYARVRHNGATLGASEWSDAVLFTTAAEFYPGDEVARLLASDGAAYDAFGYSQSISDDGSTLIAGASGLRAAYIFSNASGSWQEIAKLTGSDSADGDNFGRSVSISGDGSTAIVGAHEDKAAYIFNNDSGTWQEVAKLTSPASAIDNFGWDVSINIDGTYAVIAAYTDPDNGSHSGAAYIFRNTNGSWEQVAKLTASDGASSDYFGQSASMSSDHRTVVIGAYADDDAGSSSGSAYIFSIVGGLWQQVAKLTASDAAASDNFGRTVSIDGDGSTAIIGAYQNDDNGTNSGSAYIFSNASGSWQEVAKLTASDASNSDRFGGAVSISDDGGAAIIGAHFADIDGAVVGAAYIFSNASGSWQEVAKLTSSDATTSIDFGSGVSISGDGGTAIVGANDDDDGSNIGSVYIFV